MTSLTVATGGASSAVAEHSTTVWRPMRNRRVAALLVLVVLLVPAAEASAAGTKLSAKPPGPMGSASTNRGSSQLPYTGLNLWADLLVAAVLLSAGVAI